MASDTATGRTDPPRRNSKSARRISGLSLRILAVNLAALLILSIGVMYVGTYRERLLALELDSLSSQTALYAAALAECTPPLEETSPEEFDRHARAMIARLEKSQENSESLLVSISGRMLWDSISPPRPPRPPERGTRFSLSETLDRSMAFLVTSTSIHYQLPAFPDPHTAKGQTRHGLPDAMTGTTSINAWERDGSLTLSAAAPVMRKGRPEMVLLIIRNAANFDEAVRQARMDAIMVALAGLGSTIMLSIYLSGAIATPLQRLAQAAESVRRHLASATEIPDFSTRGDEIGELSLALRDMTRALQERMQTIERFAADVAHELKNPLTSLRSAVETARIVKSAEDRERLMDIVLHDVQRLNRLISDISGASRLDAELSRERPEPMDFKALLHQVVSAFGRTLDRLDGPQDTYTTESGVRLVLDLPGKPEIPVLGVEGRLAQVLRNLVGNALSFAPESSRILLRLRTNKPRRGEILLEIEDEGPGIPDAKLEAIFDRFYSERPKHEDFGSHSGLGLFIARQIVTAHGGHIWAENLKRPDGSIMGARFSIVLNAP